MMMMDEDQFELDSGKDQVQKTQDKNQNVERLKDANLFVYPPGRGGIKIATHDFLCLGAANYINDTIIEFYLSYIYLEMISPDQRIKSYIFSVHFFSRLKTPTMEDDPNLSTALNQHLRVARWTKDIDIFEKDFIFIPIHDINHWYLVIIWSLRKKFQGSKPQYM